MGFLIGLLLDVVLSFFIASFAQSKGRSFVLWFIISIVFDPIVGLLTLLLVSAVAKLLRPSKTENYPDRSIIDVSARPVSEPFSTVAPDVLYSQSENIFQQAAKMREAADQLYHDKNHDAVERIGNRY